MIETIVDAQRHRAGEIESVLAAPVGLPDGLRSVGPFAVVAHALPHDVLPGELPPDFDVRPHPHIGLAAVTYMLDGHVTHRDSLGSRSEVGPGGLNFMIAGRGIVHSERFDRLRTSGGRLQMMQILLALPDGFEDAEPAFCHLDADVIAQLVEEGVTVRWLAGATPGYESRLSFPSPMFLHDAQLEPGGRYLPPDDFPERAVYVMTGSVEVDGTRVDAQQIALLAPGSTAVQATEAARLLVFGGEPVGPRYAWWNFMHSSLERIEAAKADWRAGRTELPPGDTEAFAPAPADDGRPLYRLNMSTT